MRFQGRIDEQCSSVPYSSIFHFSTAYKSSTSFHTNNYFTSSIQFFTAGTSKLSRLLNFYCRFLVLHHSLIEDTLSNSVTASNSSTFEFFLFSKTEANTSFNLSNSDAFYVEQSSDEPSPPRNKSPKVLNSTELSGVHLRQAITISTVASPGRRLITINLDLNDPTIPCD